MTVGVKCKRPNRLETTLGLTPVISSIVAREWRLCNALHKGYTLAMELVDSGVDLIYIRDLLGHESVRTTKVYA